MLRFSLYILNVFKKLKSSVADKNRRTKKDEKLVDVWNLN